MLNYWIETQTDDNPSKGIVRMSYKIVSWKRFKAMDKEKRKKLIEAIDKFQQMLNATKKEIKKFNP